jgi:hypothetical protein
MNKITDSPRAAKNDGATDAIRYSGAISDRITRQSSSPMTTIATGTTRARSLSERGQEFRHRDGRYQPGRDDDPAKFDGERADSPEYGVNAHGASLQTGRALHASHFAP